MKKIWWISPIILLLSLAVITSRFFVQEAAFEPSVYEEPFDPKDMDPHYRPTYKQMNECRDLNKVLISKILESESNDSATYIAIAGLAIAFLAMLPSWISLFKSREKI